MKASQSRSIAKDEKGAILSRIGWHPWRKSGSSGTEDILTPHLARSPVVPCGVGKRRPCPGTRPPAMRVGPIGKRRDAHATGAAAVCDDRTGRRGVRRRVPPGRHAEAGGTDPRRGGATGSGADDRRRGGRRGMGWRRLLPAGTDFQTLPAGSGQRAVREGEVQLRGAGDFRLALSSSLTRQCICCPLPAAHYPGLIQSRRRRIPPVG
jgi:hypothetical protein